MLTLPRTYKFLIWPLAVTWCSGAFGTCLRALIFARKLLIGAAVLHGLGGCAALAGPEHSGDSEATATWAIQTRQAESAAATAVLDLATGGDAESGLQPDIDLPALSKDEPTREYERGLASWYGSSLHGGRTANGERFDMHSLTAAHKTLPFGTRVRVRSLLTGKEVEVRVNDRGPFTRGRVIDLSRAAAEALGLLGLGVKNVLLLVPTATELRPVAMTPLKKRLAIKPEPGALASGQRSLSIR